jgi:glycosyltransferase involved in cell wall biosynthesis
MGNVCIGDFIEKWYKTKPNYVAYGGVGISNSKLKIQNKIKQESAVFIGRLDEQTGILTYVEAIERLKKKIPNFGFLIIGDGKPKDEINREIKILKPLNNVSKYFHDYNFAFVSGYLSILEAMVARRLVFAVYNNPLKEDYLRMAPFSKCITISNSSSELVSKVFFYLNNPAEKEKLVEKAYAWVQNHTWEKMADVYLKIWKI